MNQRIKELAEQAGAHETGHAYYRGEKKPENAVTLHSVDLELFAELIVRECMRMCEVAEVGYDTHGHTKEANGCVSSKEYIAEHFGVEE